MFYRQFLSNLTFIAVTSGKIKTFVLISIVKSTRCTNVLNLFYFGMALYMFRTVFPSIISSSRLYIHMLLTACYQADSSICLTYACCCMYSLELLMAEGETVRNM